MIRYYKCGECDKKITIEGVNLTDIECPFCKHKLKGDPMSGTVLADVMKQNGSAILREFLCTKCNSGPYYPVGAYIQATLCPKCGQRCECTGQSEVFPKATYVK